jgi:ferric-dicitrate binding protein FerR (iron transport regulator)
LIGSVTGNRQASAAQDRIDAWLLNHPTQQPAEAAPPPVRRPRLAALGIIAACMAVFVLTGLVVHLIVVGS